MRKSDLFDIAIKLFGISLLIETIVMLKDFFMFVGMQLSMPESEAVQSQTNALIYGYAASIAVALIVAFLLIFQSRWIVRKTIRSADNPPVDFTIDKRSGLEIAFVIIGGLVITKAMSALGYQLIKLVELIQSELSQENKGFAQIIWQIVLIIIGFFVIAARKSIAGYFIRRDERQN